MRLSPLLHSCLPIFLSIAAVVSAGPCTLNPSGGDDAPAFLKAVQKCSTVTIPQAATLNISTRLNMTGLRNKHIDLKGTIRFNPDLPYWTGHAFYFDYQTTTTFWLFGGKNLRIDGGGTIDGAGQAWWDARPTNTTLLRPISFTIYQASKVVIKDIRLINSPFWFTFTNEATDVVWSNISIDATSTSANVVANSDGWDIYRSDRVVIKDSVINSGDDCVSFKPNATNVLVSNLNCNGTHGISVGSLGQYAGAYDIVENITAINIKMSNASNGARIKAWAGPNVGAGFVKNITFQNFGISRVDIPLTIDQCYMTNATACSAFPSNVYIQDVWFNNITGVATRNTVSSLLCSPGARCNNINVNDINLLPGSGTATYACQNIALLGNSAKLFPEACRAVV